MAVDDMASGSNSFALLAGQHAQQLPVKQEAGSTAALGHGTARDKDVKLSKNLMGLKFMQRAAQKTEPAQHRAAAKAAIKEVLPRSIVSCFSRLDWYALRRLRLHAPAGLSAAVLRLCLRIAAAAVAARPQQG